MARERVLFVTGKLAEKSLRRVVDGFASTAGVEPLVEVLPITVAALANTGWIAKRLEIPEGVSRVILPGLCAGRLEPLQILAKGQVTFEKGPLDLLDLPAYFSQPIQTPDLTRHSLEIIAEINHAPRLSRQELIGQAMELSRAGADRIDVGCDPGQNWPAVGEAVKALVDLGMKVSIDSFEPAEVENAVKAGATLVLSVNGQNRHLAPAWGVEVVAIPDRPGTLEGLAKTVEFLEARSVPHRLDPILDPVGHDFGESLLRFAAMGKLFPGKPVMMGVGNVTELAEVDSSGVNLVLVALAREWGVGSVLTTQVANWCRTAVQEIDHLRRVVELAVSENRLAKYLDPAVLMLRDRRARQRTSEDLVELQRGIKDANFRILVAGGEIHVMNSRTWVRGVEPFALMRELAAKEPLDPSHALYLGYEISKAVTAKTLGKNYNQDRPLDWGFLTCPEVSHRGQPDGSEPGDGQPG